MYTTEVQSWFSRLASVKGGISLTSVAKKMPCKGDPYGSDCQRSRQAECDANPEDICYNCPSLAIAYNECINQGLQDLGELGIALEGLNKG